MNERGRITMTAPTDAEGRFQLLGVPDGPYALRVLRGETSAWSPETFEVRGADVNLGTIELPEHVVRGRVTDDTGRPVAGAEIRLLVQDEAGARLTRTTTAANGRWTIEAVPAGTHTAEAAHAGLGTDRLAVEVPTTREVELVLGRTARVLGRVLAGDAPFTGVMEVRLEAEHRGGRRIPPRSFRDADGRFVVDGVPPGLWNVHVRTPSGHVGRTASPIEVRASADFEVTLVVEAAATIRGRVETAAGAPVASARITAVGVEGSRRRSVHADAHGTFRMADLPANTYTLQAEGAGGAPSEETVHLAPGESLDVVLALAPAGTVRLEVVDGGGRPIAGALLHARDESGVTLRSSVVRADERGRARLSGMPVGRLEVLARTLTGERGTAWVEVRAGGETHAQVRVGAP